MARHRALIIVEYETTHPVRRDLQLCAEEIEYGLGQVNGVVKVHVTDLEHTNEVVG